ncbi:MAG TPA: bifunctional ornithine acetyltransferase/N-acetylglutamate synthase, partial [Gammaproteobacteria bacterium]
AGRTVFAKPEIKLHIDLGRGLAEYVYWTCDLSHEYVRINAEYRT